MNLSPVIAMALGLATCGGKDIDVVATPGGLYTPGGDCNPARLQAGEDACAATAQMHFDEAGMDSMLHLIGLTDVHQTCKRSYCGAGSLTGKATLRNRVGIADGDRILTAQFLFTLEQPIEMMGKTVSFKVFVENFTTPLHGQMFVVVNGMWHQVNDGPLRIRDLWNEVSGLVSPTNQRLNMDAGVTSIPVSQLVLQVYLPSPVESGDMDNWTGDVYIDDVRWQ